MKKQSRVQESDLPKIGAPATRALNLVGVRRLADLTRFRENEVKQLHGVGPYAINKLRLALHEKGLSFKT